ncbi:DEAD/DEAH box helicase [Rhizobium straminoryzae]|uniref:Restriction endonuclease subunit R n=1 Tax=Rhizobium straminoryzae TaxID=1387186 RepID=A0A549SZR6_9HYPH|nr:DEAD/DEAH box helicase family protein [Rhizobium straminoryzae]TRL35048.1 restriction endonuclease subunit R [Rhizobium straminoryzae]
MALPVFSLKTYQLQTLASLRRFLEKTVELNDADTAFYALTKRPFFQPPGLPGQPYVCLRVPTGGGKTILAAHSIAVAADAFLRCDNPTVLWLVPSDTIREQTLATLSDRAHPNRRALADRFGENVRVMTIQDALYAKRADYDGGAVVIVATIQAFRVEKTEGRKVYEANGELMDHFSGLANEQRAILETGPSGDPLPSLANVLRMRRPMVIVDEAHNARTDLSFDTLGRLSPSLIVEFTATPVTPEEHKPEKGIYASNVLHHVSAAELKAEEMIKLPVILRGRADPRDTISDAMAWLDELSATARAEENMTGEFVRPVMLVQAEPRSKDKPTLHADEVKKLLVEDFRVPEEHIVIATGDSKGLDGVDLFDRDCKVRFIITQQALKEGWDCSFAYVLCSVAEQKSARAVEQLLGRVLRLPGAKWKKQDDLNRAYAFATTTSFQNAANTLRDGLVNNGFERVEAQALVRAVAEPLHGLEPGGVAYVYEEAVPFELDFHAFEKNIHTLTGGRVEFDAEKQIIRARGALTDYDKTALLLALPDAAAGMVEALVHKSRGARLKSVGEEKEAIGFAVPRLAVQTAHGLQLFDRGHFLDIPWKLENDDPSHIMDFFVPPKQARDEAHVDVDQSGHVNVAFVTDLHEQLMLNLQERGWTKNALVNWLDRRLPFTARRDITRVSSTLFISKALDHITAQTGMAIEALARAKFRIVEALVKVIAKHRDGREIQAFQQALIPQGGLDFKTSAELELVFEESRYAYREPYKGRVDFKKHLFRVIGDLEASGEEHECAVYLERMPEVKAWVRNTSQQPNSFWLQTATDKFYPDFVALLKDGRHLVLEYKGKPYMTNDDSKEKRLVGELWADRSGGSCLFLMIEGKEFSRIDAAIRKPH